MGWITDVLGKIPTEFSVWGRDATIVNDAQTGPTLHFTKVFLWKACGSNRAQNPSTCLRIERESLQDCFISDVLEFYFFTALEGPRNPRCGAFWDGGAAAVVGAIRCRPLLGLLV
jgi:hypothetical protein